MRLNGRVLKVRESPYVDKKTNQPVIQLYLDVYDDTVGLVNAELRKGDGVTAPLADSIISADVQMLRPSKFGTGVSVVIKAWQSSGDLPAWTPPQTASTGSTSRK